MFQANCLPILIGSLPLTDHSQAVRTILAHSPEIPLWPQLPRLPKEGMVRQFLDGFPGLHEEEGRFWIDSAAADFEEQMAAFYEEYLELEAGGSFAATSRFGLMGDNTAGFAALLETLEREQPRFTTLKGQVTGPVTTGIGVRNQENRSIFYDDNLRDMLIKHLTLKARWQVEMLRPRTDPQPPIIFIDEPGIVSFGSSAFVGISKEMVSEAVAEVVAGIQAGGGLAGIHICANGDWSPALASNTDIISFDAYFYFDNFILYRDLLTDYLAGGGILAWGIVPTSDPEVIEATDAGQLYGKWQEQVDLLVSFGIDRQRLLRQTLIAPSCGTGSLSPRLALKVLEMTAEVSSRARTLTRES